MDTTISAPISASLTPELLAAVEAGDGWVRIADPETNRVFVVVEQSPEKVKISDDVKKKLDEAHEDVLAGRIGPLDIEEIKVEVRRRLALKSQSK